MPFICSTSTNDMSYAFYVSRPNTEAPHIIKKRILINGGHGVVVPGTKYTPIGMITEVSDSDLELLETNISFRKHVKAGFLVVTKSKAEPPTIAQNMNLKDGSAPVTLHDFDKTIIDTGNSKISTYRAKGKRDL